MKTALEIAVFLLEIQPTWVQHVSGACKTMDDAKTVPISYSLNHL